MKKILVLFVALFSVTIIFAQSPEKISFQAIIRNSYNQLITNQPVGIKISVLQESINGNEIYVETQNPTTNANGLISIEIGNGNIISGNFSLINWANGTYFIKTETDINGGSNYTIVGTSQLLSVPYALHAKTVENITENDPVFNLSVAKNISYSDFNNWNTAFTWGNHANAGYLSNFTEMDPVFNSSLAKTISNSDTNKWNSSYRWGNHKGLYRSNSWVPSWTDIISKPTFATIATSGSYVDLTNKPANATTTTDGFMSKEDKTKLNGLQNANGSETKITAGTNVTITGSGTTASPYVVNASGGSSIVLGTNVGDMLYWNGTTWAKVPVGTAGQYLQLSASKVPTWAGPSVIQNLPVLSTVNATELSETSTKLGGNITNNGGYTITARGVCWNTSPNPDLGNNHTTDGTGTGVFTSNLTGLTPNTKYYVRAYATNSAGTAYGEEFMLHTLIPIGTDFQGGKVIYCYKVGEIGYVAGAIHGLISSTSDQSAGIIWSNNSTLIGGTETGIGSGQSNTNKIVANQGAGNYAAKLCYDLELNGYSDWYLPSKDELFIMWENRNVIGGFNLYGFYWSSTEYEASFGGFLEFPTGMYSGLSKYANLYVRAVRSF